MAYLLFYDFAGLEGRTGLPVPTLGPVGFLRVLHQLLRLEDQGAGREAAWKYERLGRIQRKQLDSEPC